MKTLKETFTTKRMVALLLVICILVSILPLTFMEGAFAAEGSGEDFVYG